MVNFFDLTLEEMKHALAAMKAAARPNRTRKVLVTMAELRQNGVCPKHLTELESKLTMARQEHSSYIQDELLEEMEIELGLY